MKSVDNEGALGYWVERAKRGDRVVYYEGLLMRDRQHHFLNGGFVENQPERLRTARLAWKLYENGEVGLCQRKVDEYEYEYIAFKR